jgi:hypothetical protein
MTLSRGIFHPGLRRRKTSRQYLRTNAPHARIRSPTFPMDRSKLRQLGIISTARVLLASVLLTAFLSAIVPWGSVSAGSMCTLECCAGRAPHASGSCMDGSCHATLLTAQAAAKNHQPDQIESFCGLTRKIETKSFVRMRVDVGAHSSPNQFLAAAFKPPCQADCGGCTSGFTNSNRQRNSGAFAGANRPRPPTDAHLFDFRYQRTRILTTNCRPGAPRGPPVSFS